MSDELELERQPAVPTAGTMRGFLPGIRFRPDDGGGGGGDGGAGGEAGAALSPGAGGGEPGAGEAAPSTAATAAAPTWTPDDPAILDLVDTRARAIVDQQFGPLVPLLEQMLGGDDGNGAGGGGVELNPWADDFGANFAQLLAQERQQTLAQMQQMFQGIAGPLAAREQAETVAEGEQRLKDILADDIARNGEFSAKPEADAKARQLVRRLADQLFPEVAARYGATPRAAELAMNAAAGQVREILAAERESAVGQEHNRLSGLAGANGEPGGAGAGFQGPGEIRARSMDEGLSAVTQRHAALIRGQ